MPASNTRLWREPPPVQQECPTLETAPTHCGPFISSAHTRTPTLNVTHPQRLLGRRGLPVTPGNRLSRSFPPRLHCRTTAFTPKRSQTRSGPPRDAGPKDWVLYSHASLHQHRLDPAAAPGQREVDAAPGQDHPLAPQAAALKQSEGGQRELLEEPGQLLAKPHRELGYKKRM